MSAFADGVVLGLRTAGALQTFLATSLGAASLFDLVYQADDVELQQLQITGVREQRYAVPAFETIRTRGVNERITPTSERIKIDREQPRLGRLAWIDVLATVDLEAAVADKAMPIERITVQTLIDKIGGAASVAELKTKLAALYTESIVDAFFERHPIADIGQFTRKPTLFLQFVFKEPPPFDPADPKSTRRLSLDVCIQVRSDLQIVEALQGAKLCRSILENENDAVDRVGGFTVVSPFAFVVVFPAAAAVDNAIPGLTAAQIKTAASGLFQAERMLAHFA